MCEISKEELLQITPMFGFGASDKSYVPFDLDEIDDLLYMVNRYCSGTVQFRFSEEIIKKGKVFLNGREHFDWDVILLPDTKRKDVLSVKLRGHLMEYGTTAILRVEGFEGSTVSMAEPIEFTVKINERRDERLPQYAEHDKIAEDIAKEAIVLLHNNGALPMAKDSTLNLFGRGITEFRNSAIGAAKVNCRCCRNFINAVLETSHFELNEELVDFYRIANNNIPSEEILQNSLLKNKNAVMVITRGASESIDCLAIKGEYYLSDEEEALLEKLSNTFENVIVILNIGCPIDMSFIEKYNVSACIFTSFGGMFATESVLSVLSGETNPSGKLATTFCFKHTDVPSTANYLTYEGHYAAEGQNFSQIVYEEGPYIGYRYFTSFNKECAYPFGYGLSYTSFKTECKMTVGETLKFNATVQNIGKLSGKEVVQIYVRKPCNELSQVAIELIGYAKTKELTLKEAEEIEINVPFEHLKSYDSNKNAWILSKGEYKFFLGADATKLTEIDSFIQDNTVLLKQTKKVCVPPIDFEEISPNGKTVPNGNDTFFSVERPFPEPEMKQYTSTKKSSGKFVDFSEVMEKKATAEEFVSQMTDYELCRLNVCSNKSWSMVQRDAAGFVVEFEHYGMPMFALCDGNNCVNVPKPTLGLPTSWMVACTFNADLAYEAGKAIAEEAIENKIDVILAPGMNLHRNPLCGRTAEYFSEDPFLSGTMAGYYTKGLQENGVSGSIKHVVANNCETRRAKSDSIISERTLREIYIRNFEYAMEIEMPDTIMTAYNALNGSYTAENSELINDIFRDEFGFDGFFMTDWNSYNHGNIIEMAVAGQSLLTPGSTDDIKVSPLTEALENHQISRDMLESNAAYMVKIMAKRLKFRKALEK